MMVERKDTKLIKPPICVDLEDENVVWNVLL